MQANDVSAEPASSMIDQHMKKSQLRFLTCGSVDDGKSTLIGRLLYDAHVLTTDQIANLRTASRNTVTSDEKLDFSLLLDGLSAEREQGITIDVAYRYFSTSRRSFVVADCPGHEQYTRNMVTGASNCELAIVLVDATKGILSQTRRHALIAATLGLKKLVLAVNKMDLVDWEQQRFEQIAAEFQHFLSSLGPISTCAIPVSGLLGANVVQKSSHMNWYVGPTLLEHLESVPSADQIGENGALRVVVQGTIINSKEAHNASARAITGFVASGTALEGERVRIMPAGRTTSIARILMPSDPSGSVKAGRSITFCLEHETDCGRGDLVCAQNDAP